MRKLKKISLITISFLTFQSALAAPAAVPLGTTNFSGMSNTGDQELDIGTPIQGELALEGVISYDINIDDNYKDLGEIDVYDATLSGQVQSVIDGHTAIEDCISSLRADDPLDADQHYLISFEPFDADYNTGTRQATPAGLDQLGMDVIGTETMPFAPYCKITTDSSSDVVLNLRTGIQATISNYSGPDAYFNIVNAASNTNPLSGVHRSYIDFGESGVGPLSDTATFFTVIQFSFKWNDLIQDAQIGNELVDTHNLVLEFSPDFEDGTTMP